MIFKSQIFLGLPPSTVRFQGLESVRTFTLLFRLIWCLFVLCKPKGQNPHLSGTFISWGKKESLLFALC